MTKTERRSHEGSSEQDAPAVGWRRPNSWAVLLLGLLGLVYRVEALTSFPVVHDEMEVIARGMSQSLESGHLLEILFRTPVTNSNGITPLWWWIQLPSSWLFGETSKLGLRLLPLILGLTGICLAYRAAQRLGGARSAWFAGLLYAVGDLILYTNSKGEFAASLIGPLALALLLDLLPRPDTTKPRVRIALWPALVLLSYFGQGVILWGSYAVYLGCSYVTTRLRNQDETRGGFFPMVGLILLPLVPSLIWMLAAQAILFDTGSPLLTDIGPVSSIWEQVSKLTWGYGTVVKPYMVGGWRDALYVYTDFKVWPTLALITVPGIAMLAQRGLRVARRLLGGEPGPIATDLIAICFIVPALSVLLAKGVVGARFHLLYLAFGLPFVAVAIDDWLDLLERGRAGAFACFAVVECLWVAWTGSQTIDPPGPRSWGVFWMVAAIGLTLAAVAWAMQSWSRLRPHIRPAATVIVSAVVLVSSQVFGPLEWAQRLAWEPEPNKQRPASVSRFQNPDLQLAMAFLGRETGRERLAARVANNDRARAASARAVAVARSRRLLVRALDRHPDDRATLLQAGAELFHFSRRDRGQVVDLWQAYAGLHPDDQAIRRMLTLR